MTQREILRKRLRLATILGVVLVLISYGVFQARNLALGPIVEVTEPADGAVVTSPEITIAGTAKNIAFMTLNGQEIYTDTEGAFSEDRTLSLGYNVITLSARDKFGKETTRTIYITFQ